MDEWVENLQVGKGSKRWGLLFLTLLLLGTVGIFLWYFTR